MIEKVMEGEGKRGEWVRVVRVGIKWCEGKAWRKHRVMMMGTITGGEARQKGGGRGGDKAGTQYVPLLGSSGSRL